MTSRKPARRYVVVLYGLPGAGKSSLARHIGETCPGWFFADVASHPEYGELAMHRCVTDLYFANGRGKHLITEGVLATPDKRNGFARNIQKSLAIDKRYKFRAPRLVFVNEAPATLSSRRPARAVETYEEMMGEFLVGSGQFPHGLLDGDAFSSLDERAAWLVAALPTMVADHIDDAAPVTELAALGPAQDGNDGHAPGDAGGGEEDQIDQPVVRQ